MKKSRQLVYTLVLGFLCTPVLAGEKCKPVVVEKKETPGLVQEKPADGRFVKTDKGYMVPYEQTIPGTDVTFKMVPIPGGKFTIGSPDSEANRSKDEGPQFVVEVEPFWMAACEVSWDEYHSYMAMHDLFKSFVSHKMRQINDMNRADAVSAPSNLYDPTFTYDAGDDPQQPAVTMTQFAAKQYTKWLSGLTTQFHRLPSEAEWEYACRAGTTTAYSFGNDATKLGDYAWNYDNADDLTHQVGQKKPNPWGLYDMHGNVAEWCLDEYKDDAYKKLAEAKEVKAANAVVWPTVLWPRALRGGSWDSDVEQCRSASRWADGDEDEWKQEDPNIPYSPWWYTSYPSTCVGFRVIRPLNEPEKKEVGKYWDADLKDEIQEVVNFRINSEGRGALGLVDSYLLDDIKKLSELKKKNK